ncbi:MAG TPA: lipocalin family protein [Cyclobacteriaceae bacterium]|nr:lipocalin family protein [Cyclobacteriaceae bacterium]
MKKLLPVILVILVVACGKDDPKPSTTEMLTAPTSGWLQTSILVTIPGSTSTVDVFNDPKYASSFPACDKDNAMLFKVDGKYSVENNTKCDTTEPAQLETGTWKLSADEKSITFTPSGDTAYTATILSISETELKAELTLDFGTTPIKATVTMKPK